MDTEKGARSHVDDNILLCLLNMPPGDKVIEIATRMAKVNQGMLTALLINPSADKNVLEEDRAVLHKKLVFAGQSSAQIITINGYNIAQKISSYAKENNITKIVVGNSINKSILGFCVQNNSHKLARLVFPDIEVYEVN